MLPDRAVLLAAAAGLALGAGQVPWSIWPLALIGLALGLALAAAAPTPRQGAVRVLALGLGHFALSLSWIVEPFLVDAARHGWMAPLALVAMSAGFAGFWALGAWAGLGLVRGCGPGLRMLAVALGLGVADLVRSHLFGGFPWVLLGHIWLETPVVQTAAIWGAPGLGLLTLGVALTLARLGACAQRRGLWAAGVVALTLLPWLWGGARLGQPLPPDTGAKVRLVQPDADQALKWDPAARETFWQRLLAGTAAPMPDGGRPDLIIWPESAVPFLLNDSAPERLRIAQAAAGAQVLLGIQRSEGFRYFNTMALLDPAGEVAATYDKHHLVPFGEFIPFGDQMLAWFGITAFAAQEGAGFTPGPGPLLIDTRAGAILPLICYEAVFPAAIRAAPARPAALVQATNDAWFGRLSGPYQHLSLARLRAVEFGLPMLRAANTGVSAVIDARGRVLTSLGLGAEGHLDAPLPAALPPTPYARFGDGPVHLALMAALAALLLVRRRNRH